MAHYTEYYVRQAQTGNGMHFYAGSASQRGYGLGSLLGGLFRNIVLPLFSSGAKTVGQEALRAGSHILADVASGEVPFGLSMQRHVSQAGENLLNKAADKMKGKGIKRRAPQRGAQSGRVKRPTYITRRGPPADIYSNLH